MENNWLRRRVLEKKNPGRQQPCWGSLFCTNLTQPTGNLDAESAENVAAMLSLAAAKYKQTIVMVTHDKQMAEYADRILNIVDGQVRTEELMFN